MTVQPWKTVITAAGRDTLAIPPVPEVPGEAHAQLIRSFNGGPLPTVPIDPVVYDECRANGWTTMAETGIGAIATPVGCAAIGEPLGLPRYSGRCPRAAAAARYAAVPLAVTDSVITDAAPAAAFAVAGSVPLAACSGVDP